MTTCLPPGYGSGIWGKDPWGGSLLPSVGGPLPVVPPFDVYCVGPCGPISSILSHPEVSTYGDGTQFPVDFTTLDQEMLSGGTYLPTEAALFISKSIPASFTFEFTVQFTALPPNFSDIVSQHIYFGTFCPSGAAVGLFFSNIGIAYAGVVHIDGTGTLALDSPMMTLPGSYELVSTTDYWTVRIAASSVTGATYIYVTKTADLPSIGHQLRYVMPTILGSSAALTPPSETLIAVRGTPTAPSFVSLSSVCVGTGLIVPAIPPKADAGLDQALRFCSILQLDGSKSFDPQGAELTYAWRLLDAPLGSQYIFDGADGRTYPGTPATGFTNRFYSASLGTLNSVTPIPSGDVLVVAGVPYTITGTGTDGDGFYVRTDSYTVPDSFSSNTTFKYLKQNGLNTATSEKPTFYPDVPGIFKFDLVVFDGSLYSEPSTTIANVVESNVARGCTPDLSFIWNYLSDFWGLLEDGQRIEVFWQGMAQVAAAELLSLWQVDYSKSLRDIQRTFQRRWLHYDLLMQENPNLVEVSTVRAILSGIESVDIPITGVSGVAGTHLDLLLGNASVTTSIAFAGTDPVTPAQLQVFLQSAFAQLDPRIVVQLIVNNAATSARLRIDAPYTFTVVATSTSPLFVVGRVSAAPSGTAGGSVVSNQTYRVERSLQGLDIKLNDFLCIDGIAYRIARVIDDPGDTFPSQRLALVDALPTSVGAVWSIAGTAVSSDLDFWNGLCAESDLVTFEVVNTQTQALVEVAGTVLGASAALTANLPIDATAVTPYLANAAYAVFFKSVLRRGYIPVDPLIVDVPYLQEKITSTDDTQVLRRNVDFFIDTFRGQSCIRFVTPIPAVATPLDVWQGAPPPAMLWAETTYLDNRPKIESNFGIPASFTLDDLAQLPSSVDYLSAVRGLWYTYFNGPTVFDIRAGTQILLGLPFAEEAGVITEIRNDFSTTQGRILVQDAADASIVREYTYPAALSVETNPTTGKPYVVGDSVTQFAPLVTGVEVKDWVNDPTWFQGYLEQGAFFEIEKYFKFLVRVDGAAFTLPALLFVQSFIKRIKPTYTYPLFVVLETVDVSEVTVTDLVVSIGTLNIYDGACFNGTEGVATMFDQPRPAGGGWRSQFDASATTPPSYPTPTTPIIWGFDKNYLCPEDAIVGTICLTLVAPAYPTMDSIFAYDLPVYSSDVAVFSAGAIASIAGPGTEIGDDFIAASSGTINRISLELQALDTGTPNTYDLNVFKNFSLVASIPFTLTAGGFDFSQALSLTVNSGDHLSVSISPSGGVATSVLWTGVMVTLGQATTWAYDTTLPAGTYCVYKEL